MATTKTRKTVKKATKKVAKKARAAKKVAKKATKRVAKKAVTKRTRATKNSPYVSIATGKPVTESWAIRNPTKAMARPGPVATPEETGPEATYTYNDQPAPTMYGDSVDLDINDNTGDFEDAQLDINTALITGAEDAIFWAVVRKGLFTAKVIQLFNTRARAEQEARQLDQESGLSFNSYVVQRAPLNLDLEYDPGDSGSL